MNHDATDDARPHYEWNGEPVLLTVLKVKGDAGLTRRHLAKGDSLRLIADLIVDKITVVDSNKNPLPIVEIHCKILTAAEPIEADLKGMVGDFVEGLEAMNVQAADQLAQQREQTEGTERLPGVEAPYGGRPHWVDDDGVVHFMDEEGDPPPNNE